MSIVLQNFVQVSQGARDLNLQPLIPGGIALMDAERLRRSTLLDAGR